LNDPVSQDQTRPLPLPLARHVDEVCCRFEAAWKAAAAGGEPPRLEAYLAEVAEPAHAVLLRELQKVEAHYRRGAGAGQPAGGAADVPHWHPAVGSSLVPGYELLGGLGSGGMGVVYKARQLKLNRVVALKTLRGSRHIGPKALQRFQREAEAVAQLQHPNIVQIHEVGEHEGRPYLALEFVPGGNLDQHLSGTPQPAQAAAGLVRTLALAVQHAHERGILHRDLKPANVLLSAAGADDAPGAEGALADVTPKITDFGLAKLLDEDAIGPTPSGDVLGTPSDVAPEQTQGKPGTISPATGPTQSGEVFGTPSYMAPEQTQGKPGTTSPATDVYGLGAILYECLTGRPPFKAETALETLLQVRSQEPVSPGQLQPKCPRDLVTICLKCLRKEPARRYPSARELADDLRRFLHGEPIRARPVGAAERTLKWVRRHPATVAWLGLATAVLVVVALVAGGTYRWHQQREARDRGFDADLTWAAELREGDRWDDADRTLQQAEDRLEGGGAEEQRGRLERARADLTLAKRLDGIRLDKAVVAGGRFNYRGAEKGYEEAFREGELGTAGEDPEAVAARVRASAVQARLVAALDDWAATTADPQRRAWLLDVARQADPHPVRDRFRDPKAWGDQAALRRLAQEAPQAETSPSLLMALAERLKELGDALPLLRRAQARHPRDFWLNFELANALLESKVPGEALGFYWVAMVLRPGLAVVYNQLGLALHAQGDLKGAVAAYHEALERSPEFAAAHTNLGNALFDQKDVKGAIARHRLALQYAPRLAAAHYNLGLALHAQGDLKGAIAAYGKALAEEPRDAAAHYNLGNALREQKNLKGATAAYQKAIEYRPTFTDAHNNLGLALHAQEDVKGAIAAWRKALKCDPKLVEAHYNVGSALFAQGDLEGAEESYRQAVAHDPQCVDAHGNLGTVLLSQGRFPEAERATRAGLALLPAEDPRRAAYSRQLRRCGVLLALNRKLPAVLLGSQKPGSAGETLELASLCRRPYKQLYHASALLYRDAFTAEPKLADDLAQQHRRHAACAAALASADKGVDAAGASPKEQARLRRQALDWLRADLAAYTRLVEKGDRDARQVVQQRLTDWLGDADLASVREPQALKQLSPDEEATWRRLWADVDALRTQLGSRRPGPK
jgi:eukaryotic-like serine/threonine-protein kinase